MHYKPIGNDRGLIMFTDHGSKTIYIRSNSSDEVIKSAISRAKNLGYNVTYLF